jgi:hypothetical protein
MHVVFTHHATQNPYILGIAHLDEQLTATLLDISRQNLETTLSHPD